jgi:hypothetical protein
MTSTQWEAFTERAGIMEYEGGLDRKAATLAAFALYFPGDYRAMKETAAAYPDGETIMYEYLEGLIKNGPQSVIEGPGMNAETEKAETHGKAPDGPPMARYAHTRREGIEALQYFITQGIALKDFYSASLDNAKESYSLDIQPQAGQRYKAFIRSRFLCLDLDVKNDKNGITSLDRLLTAWGKPHDKRPAALRDIPLSFPCYTLTPSGGVHLYFKYGGPVPDGKAFSKEYPGIDIMATQITAPGSFKEGKPYVLYGNLDQAPNLYPFIAEKLPWAKQEPKKYIPMDKKEYGRPSWDLIIEWTDKDGRGSGGRDEYAYSLARHAASHDWPEYDTERVMENMTWNYDNSFTKSTLRKCIKSAYKTGGAA